MLGLAEQQHRNRRTAGLRFHPIAEINGLSLRFLREPGRTVHRPGGRDAPRGNPGGGRASLETGPCDHLLLYIYIVPHTLPAGNDIGDTTPFEVEIRIAYGGRRLRAEKRLINQWSGASIEMRVDSEAR